MASVQAERSELIMMAAGHDSEIENSPDSGSENDHKEETMKVMRAIRKEEVGFFNDHGLGLGVDATNPKPWTNKSSFRARYVTFENVLGINGGIVRAFNNEVTSMRQFHSNVKASVPTNSLVSVGIDAEGSRSYSVHKRSVGKKIVTRTISFQSKFRDIVHGRISNDFSESHHSGVCYGEPHEVEQKFENRLIDFVKRRTNKANVELICPDDLLDYCSKFVESYSVTHYVHSIELGACYYRTMTEEEYNTNFGTSADLGAERIAEIAITNTVSLGKRRFQSEVIKIGRMRKRGHDQNEEVEREAVVGMKLKSISSLVVKSKKLRTAMAKAVSEFINKRQNHEFGPFFICCGKQKEQLFLKVDEENQNQLVATDELDDASQFSVIRSDQGDEHFSIIYEPPVSLGSSATMGVVPSLFLCTGKSKQDEPLMMKDTVSNSQMALRSRTIEHYQKPAKLKEWVSGEDAFYIICQDRSVTHLTRRYLCVYKPNARGLESPDYITGCKPRKDRDKPDTHMLFRLIKPSKVRHCPEEIEVSIEQDETEREVPDKTESERPEIKNGSEKGPFIIATNFGGSKENIYFSVKDCNVNATTDESEASRFYIKHEKENYFRVNLHETTSVISDLNRYVTQISSEWCVPTLHLTAVVNWRGYSSHNRPLQLQSASIDARSYSYLAICDRKSQPAEDPELVDPERWFDGNEMFYIRCNAEPDDSGKSSYLCVRQKASCRRQITYSTGCTPSIKHHNKGGRSMLFKLIKVTENEAIDGEGQNRSKDNQRVSRDGENVVLNEGQETEVEAHSLPSNMDKI